MGKLRASKMGESKDFHGVDSLVVRKVYNLVLKLDHLLADEMVSLMVRKIADTWAKL
jgi:hypothetical protein